MLKPRPDVGKKGNEPSSSNLDSSLARVRNPKYSDLGSCEVRSIEAIDGVSTEGVRNKLAHTPHVSHLGDVDGPSVVLHISRVYEAFESDEMHVPVFASLLFTPKETRGN